MPSLVPMEAITHIALVTIPVYSHQVSILEFAKQLIHLYKNTFHVTCIIPTISDSPSIASKHFFDTLPSNIQCIFLPSINFEDNGHVLESQVQTLVSRYMPLYKDHPHPIEIPGCISVHGQDFPDGIQKRCLNWQRQHIVTFPIKHSLRRF
ncbi:hydroquinone glucosyltransferase [Trifolium repens]|nr:hydroquinone glucosyltransferase [Trifolium repens]